MLKIRASKIASITLAAAALTLGCASDKEVAYHYTPVVERGACATVIMPGQSVPMGSRPSCPGGVSAIGGTVIDDQRETKIKSKPIPGSDIVAAPVAAAAAPIVAAEAVVQRAVGSRESSSSQTGQRSRSSSDPVSPSAGATAGPQTNTRTAVPRDPQAAWEQAQLEALERQIATRAPAGNVAAGPSRTTAAVTAPLIAVGALGMSIADELAALQAGTRPKPALPAPALEAPGGIRAASGGVADRVADRDGDARPDHWEYREDGKLVRELFDEDGDGRPDRTVHFDPLTGLESHVQEDRNLDGRLDSWIDYREGQLARQRRDTDYDGSPDHWSFYRRGELARQEHDLNGDGFRDRIAFFEAGRLVREREDRDGDGRTDRVSHYDALERISRRDEDRDGDGMIDTRSVYEGGRLVRREMISDELVAIEDAELTTSEWSDGGPD